MVPLGLLDLRVRRGPRDRQVQTEHLALPAQWDLQALPVRQARRVPMAQRVQLEPLVLLDQ
jgi:hypothetical protein